MPRSRAKAVSWGTAAVAIGALVVLNLSGAGPRCVVLIENGTGDALAEVVATFEVEEADRFEVRWQGIQPGATVVRRSAGSELCLVQLSFSSNGQAFKRRIPRCPANSVQVAVHRVEPGGRVVSAVRQEHRH